MPGKVSTFIMILPSSALPSKVSWEVLCESMYHSVTAIDEAWTGARSSPSTRVASCSVKTTRPSIRRVSRA